MNLRLIFIRHSVNNFVASHIIMCKNTWGGKKKKSCLMCFLMYQTSLFLLMETFVFITPNVKDLHLHRLLQQYKPHSVHQIPELSCVH